MFLLSFMNILDLIYKLQQNVQQTLTGNSISFIHFILKMILPLGLISGNVETITMLLTTVFF